MEISMELAYQYIAISFNFSTTLNHLHPLQVENCDSNSRLVVDEDDMVNSDLKGLSRLSQPYLRCEHEKVNLKKRIDLNKLVPF